MSVRGPGNSRAGRTAFHSACVEELRAQSLGYKVWGLGFLV